MTNPFDSIDARLSNIENLLLSIKHDPKEQQLALDVFGLDVCKQVTGLAASTIYRNTSRNLMPFFRRDGKLYFKKDEIYNWMTENRIQTKSEFIKEKDIQFIAKRKGAKQ